MVQPLKRVTSFGTSAAFDRLAANPVHAPKLRAPATSEIAVVRLFPPQAARGSVSGTTFETALDSPDSADSPDSPALCSARNADFPGAAEEVPVWRSRSPTNYWSLAFVANRR